MSVRRGWGGSGVGEKVKGEWVGGLVAWRRVMADWWNLAGMHCAVSWSFSLFHGSAWSRCKSNGVSCVEMTSLLATHS